MNRLNRLFDNINGKKVLSIFITAGYPTLESTVPLVLELINAGADMVELGIPFSDPIADGPIIQHSSEVALRNGTTLKKTFDTVQELRKQSDMPLILMGYTNPVISFGLEKFLKSCADSAVDGIILPDLSLEESDDYRKLAGEHDIAPIFLAAPTTSDKRLIELDKYSEGFLYCVSVTGVTGERKSLTADANEFLLRARKIVKKNSLLVGFGISTPEDARSIIQHSDGVIIGSALIKLIQKSEDNQIFKNVKDFVRSFRTALDSDMKIF